MTTTCHITPHTQAPALLSPSPSSPPAKGTLLPFRGRGLAAALCLGLCGLTVLLLASHFLLFRSVLICSIRADIFYMYIYRWRGVLLWLVCRSTNPSA